MNRKWVDFSKHKVGDWVYPLENGTGTGFFNPRQWWLITKISKDSTAYKTYSDYKQVRLISDFQELFGLEVKEK